MAAVTVFVDDAVLGRFPYLCVKTGAPAEGLLTIHSPVGAQTRLGIWWLLLLAGPLGWLALLFMMWSSNSDNGEALTVQVPWTEAAQDDYDKARLRLRQFTVGSLLLIAGSFAVGLGASYAVLGGQIAFTLFLLGVVFAVAAVLCSYPLGRTQVRVHLDASRRWVTLRDVHPDFAHAVEISRSGRQPTGP